MKRRRRRRLLLTAFLYALAAGLLLLAAFLVFSRGGDQTETSAPAEETELPATEETDLSASEEEPEAQDASGSEEETEASISAVREDAWETDEITTGIDVSEFQGNIDWEQVKASGVDFAMVRVGYRSASEGEIREDACARYNLQEANKSGVRLGAYFFSTAATEEEALEEADWLCDFLSGYPVTYPVAYNCEGFQDASSRQYALTQDERSALAQVFLNEVEARGYTGMFYAARNELSDNTLWNTDALEQRYRIWVAQYLSWESERPDYTGQYAMWQYTDQGNVPGIETAVDMDIAYFGYSRTAEALGEEAGEVAADPEIGVTFTEVSETVTAKDVTNLRTTMEQGDDGNVAAQLKNGETALRTGEGNNGWSRVEYDGQTLYAVSSYLTTDLSYRPPEEEPDDGFKTKFTSVTENVTAKDVTNLRNRPSVEEPSEVIAQLHNGEVIVRTGVSDVGWSRVEYNGQTLYCISSYLEAAE